jgi:hypothetical protein
MAVMTHARKAPTSVDYRDLTDAQQARLDHVLELADSTSDAGEYNALMLGVAALAGIHIAYGGRSPPLLLHLRLPGRLRQRRPGRPNHRRVLRLQPADPTVPHLRRPAPRRLKGRRSR